MVKRVGRFVGLKSTQELLSSLVIFLTIDEQSLLDVSEKSIFSGLAVSSKVIQYPYISQKTKRTW